MISQRLLQIPIKRKRPPITLPFGDWRPDLPDYANPGALTAKNVIPAPQSYGPMPGLLAQTNALDGICRGSISAKNSANANFIYAGDDTKLYEAVDNTFTDESKVAGYAVAVDDRWEFTQFDTFVIASNYTDPVQSIAIGGGSVGAFADHFTSTNVPKAKHITTLFKFLVLGNTDDVTDGKKINRIWWSAIGDSQDLDPDAVTQSDFEDLAEGGAVTAVIGNYDYGVIFQERLIRRMVYVGSPLVFDFQPVHRLRGTVFGGSIAVLGRSLFYLSEEGFFIFDGLTSTPIGEGKIDKTFHSQFNPVEKRGISAAIDPKNKLYAIAFPGAGSTGGLPNKIFFYYWPTGRWSEAEIDIDFLVRTSAQSFTLDGLDSVGTNIDANPPFDQSFDADKWRGGDLRFGAFGTDHKLSFFNGPNLAATLDTTEAQLMSGRRSMVTNLRPLVDGGTVTCQIGGRDLLAAANSFDTAAPLDAIGECSVRNNNRYHRVRTSIAAGGTWEHAQGVDVTASPSGRK